MSRQAQQPFAALLFPGARSHPGAGLDVDRTSLHQGAWAHEGLLWIPGGPSSQIGLMLLGAG